MSETIERGTPRQRARAALEAEILDTARRHLANDGASSLSLRAIARELGMVSSAIYRYVPSRDALLTQLILAAYRSVGAAARTAEAAVQERDDHVARIVAAAHGVRDWALEHPAEYALIYGTPVPGYQAPTDTIDPAAEVGLLLLGIVAEAAAAGRITEYEGPPVPESLRADVERLAATVDFPAEHDVLVWALEAWSSLFGAISFELFGHFQNVVTDRRSHLDLLMRRHAERMIR